MGVRRLACWALGVSASLALIAPAAADDDAKRKLKKPPSTQNVLVVSNNWAGTADFINPRTFKRIARLNIIPDIKQRLAEIQMHPDRQAYFLGIRELVGEGHDQFVDDGFTSPNGRFLYVSRPSLADVVAFDLKTRKIAWRRPVAGYRADHMAISHDGRRLLVSASTARIVQQIDTRTGRITGSFESGDQPHENNFSRNGRLIYHASIGSVYTPQDDPQFDKTKGDRWFEIVDARTLKVLKRIDMGKKLDEFGEPDMSGAVRPMALAPDEKFVYFQVSFFHGFVEYDLVHNRVTRLAHLPLSEEAAKMRRQDYLLDSAHHGLAMNAAGTKLCSAGTMSNYVAITSRRTFSAKIIPIGRRPYWATDNGNGKLCFVSVAGDDRVAVVSYKKEEQIASIPVGDHPQRMRMGKLGKGFLRPR